MSGIPESIAGLLDRPVAVFGAGVSGRGVLALLGRNGAAGEVYDQKAAGARPEFSAADARRHGLVVFSPGFPPDHPWLRTARDAGCLCLAELDFASLHWKGRLIAITGTNGKTTLTEFLAHALRNAGCDAVAAGNIGHSFSALAADAPENGEGSVAVCEVSSFQAEALVHFRPEATLWTNFAEDHLERHAGMEAYFRAKWNLVERTPPQGVLAGSSVRAWADRLGFRLPEGAGVDTEGEPEDPRLAGTLFATYPQRENFLLARAWWRRAGLAGEALVEAARTFRAGPHRLAKVATKGGVEFWNDSKATNFHAVEGALAALGLPVLWIGGGKSKGGDVEAFVGRIARRIRHAFLIGETRELLAGFCRACQVPVRTFATLEEAVRAAYDFAVPGDRIVLSPGFASFDMFRGYDDRGRRFEAAVENL